MKEVNDFLDEQGIFYLIEDPSKEDKVPIQLKNGKFSRLFEPIGDLYALPNYRELDITPFFAPFYMLFFGFCLGDAGYGLLIMLAALIGLAYASKKVKPFLVLGFLLGLSTTIMGIVGGTFFGIMFGLNEEGEPLQQVSWLMEYQKFVLNSDNMMILALALGYVQVLFGMFLKAANQIIQIGWKFAVSQFGWIVIVMFAIPFYVMTSLDLIPADIGNKLWMITGIAGAVPALFFNSPGKNIFLNMGTGIWHTYNMASGLLGDVLSYIRLFALGISSAILGNVFNQLAMQSSEGVGGGIVGVLVIILILTFGHSLNFFMAALGSFVHPLRLTFVEFYKNAGFGGGGAKYKPFGKIETT
jgi:V/A-type H+-transporting ATPase subunit I